MKNLQKLGASPFPYIVSIIPRPLPTELIKGEHFVLADLLKSIPSSSSQAGVIQELQAETAQGSLVSPKPTPQAAKKKKGKKRKKARDRGFCGLGESNSSFRRC